jgi:sigma-B regulation protein RsbU (phosphoserine phosphatase)
VRSCSSVIAPPKPENEEARLQAVYDLGLLDASPDERFDRLSRIAVQVFGASHAFVSLIDRDRQFFLSRVGFSICETPREISFCAHALLSKAMFVIPDAKRDKRFMENPLVIGEPYIRFYAGQPLRSKGGELVGTFCIADTRPREFPPEEQELLRELAALVEKELRMETIIALQNRLIDSQRELLRVEERTQRELREAARYVEASLPAVIDEPVSVRWAFEPSGTLGGDGFGYGEVAPGRFALYLLDVCGHGVSSALLAVVILNVLKSRGLQGVNFSRPAEVLNALNNAFPMTSHANRFFTMWYGVLDANTGELSYASGGHPPALAIEAMTGAVTRLTSEGVVIGCVRDAQFSERTHQLHPGDMVYVFSDGAFDVRNAKGDFYSRERMEKLLSGNAAAGTSPEFLMSTLKNFSATESFKDDVSIIAARWTKPSVAPANGSISGKV